MENTSAELSRLMDDLRACRLCRDAPEAGKPLPHEPRPVFQVHSSARICIAGQAPGTRVHASGSPFTDPSGVRLRAWMNVGEDVFYDESKIAIIPMGFCFPGLDAKGGDLPPRRECAPKWRDPIFDHLPNIELILVIGQYAQAWHLGQMRKRTLTETVGEWRNILSAPVFPRVLPMPHPSWRNNMWLKKNPWFEVDLLPVLRDEIQRLIR
ncbi:MAG: uracil-DNA glycosylase family protein [Pseudomonadota bacterium]